MLNTPLKSKEIKDAQFGERYHKEELSKLLETVKEVYRYARIYRGNVHECHWISDVVIPILHQLRRLRQFEPKGQLSQIETLHM